jgi:hypothetical protein
MKILKWSGIIILIALIILQILPKELPENSDDSLTNIIYVEQIPEGVADIFKVSCFDCHSNQTNYPWYSKIVPVYYLVKRDVEMGREEVNFSDWNDLSKRKKIKALSSSIEEVEEGTMPMKIHTLIHRDAVMTDSKKEAFISWCDNLSRELVGE